MKKRIWLIIPVMLLSFGLMGVSILPSCDRSADGGVYKSNDGGGTWEQKIYISEDENLGKANVTAVAINPADSKVVYMGVEGKGIYKTTDGGDSWVRVLPLEVDIFSIAIDPNDPNNVYASSLDGSNGKIFKSPNGFEETVEEILVEAQGGLALVDIKIDHFDPAKIYAMSEQGGIFKSTDYGATWAAVYWSEEDLTSMDMSPTDSRVIYIGTASDGVLKTTDGGETWTEIVDPFDDLDGAESVSDIVAVTSDTVYTATEHGLLRTNDGGATWEVVNVLVEPGEVPVKTLVVPAASPNIIYFATGSTLHKSINRGETWSNWLLPTERTVSALVVDPNNLDVIYVGVLKEDN